MTKQIEIYHRLKENCIERQKNPKWRKINQPIKIDERSKQKINKKCDPVVDPPNNNKSSNR